VADARRQPAFNVFIHGQLDAVLSQPAAEGVLKALPALPTNFDAATTAAYIASVMQGEQAMPAPIQAQVDCLLQALARTGTA
jgi:hypothetical protein